MYVRLGDNHIRIAINQRVSCRQSVARWGRGLTLALGLVLAAPSQAGSLPSITAAQQQLAANALALPGTTVLRSPVAAMALGRMNLRDWRDYAQRALMPDFADKLGFDVDVEIGLLSLNDDLLRPEFSNLAPPAQTALTFRFSSRQGPSMAQISSNGPQRLLDQRVGGFEFERSVISSGFRQALGDESSIDVSAVFAQQGYATPGFGAVTANTAYDYPGQMRRLDQKRNQFLRQGEQSSGAGLRLGLTSELNPDVTMGASFQSRIDMEAFQNYRGIYAEPGDFDIPASANFGVTVRSGRRSAVTFDVQRVFYSEVSTFTTALLPDRFLSLLGDSASPDFNWDDLTVYQVGWSWQSSDRSSWSVSYSTSQQPEPDSPLLARALRRDVADRNISFGLDHQTTLNSRLSVNASYAPAEYYLGNPQFASPTDLRGDSIELELLWTLNF
ncbi:MAG: hypothetical protein AAF358_24155 [Pseudomonadota bacterium]